MWPEDSHISCSVYSRQRQSLREFSPLKVEITEDKNHLSFFIKKPHCGGTQTGCKEGAGAVRAYSMFWVTQQGTLLKAKPSFLTFPYQSLVNQMVPEPRLEKENPVSRLNVGGRKAS